MENRAKVSIIMPTYNVEKYFRQCLESVINQTLTDIEIIPVDDGSPDNCGAIMDEYAAKDSRIKPIHQPNGGYGKAVNSGINAATGEYIGIVETDDWCDANMFEKLYNQAKKLDADVCKCDFRYFYGNDKYRDCKVISTIAPEGKVFTIKENPQIMKHHVSIWSAIYKRDYLNKNNIRVIESRSASYQDMPFAALVYAKGAKIALVHDHLMNYRAEEGMNSSTIRTDGRLKMMPIMCQEAKKIFIDNNCWDEVKEIAYRHFYNCSFGMWLQTDEEFKPAHFEELHKLFKDMPREKVKYKNFKLKQKKVLKLIINNDYEGLRKNKYLYISSPFELKRRKFIQIRWNSHEKFIRLFGKTIIKKEV